MSVQIQENWTDIEGKVLDVRPSPTRNGFVEIEISVEAAKPVPHFVDFLGKHVGGVLVVSFREDCIEGKRPVKGSRISVRVRRGQRPDQVFAHTRDFSIEP